jgi:hypothetical protein
MILSWIILAVILLMPIYIFSTSIKSSIRLYYWVYPFIILLYYFIMPFYYHFHIKKININDPSYNTSYLTKQNLALSSFLLSVFVSLIIWNIAVYNIAQLTHILNK